MPGTKPKRSYGQRIRPTSREPGQGRIRKLQCFEEVYDRILEGWPMSEVARFVQDVKKEATDLTRGGLMQALHEFRQTIPAAELTKRRISPVFVDAVKEVEEGLDELKEIEKLYKLQMRRIEIDVQNEKNIKKLLPTTGQEVRIAKEILSTYADLKMDLGLSKRHLGQMDVDARVMADVALRYNKTEVRAVMEDAQSRKKVLSLVERLMSKSAGTLVEAVKSSSTIDVAGDPVEAAVSEGEGSLDASLNNELEGNLLAEDEALVEDDPLAGPIDVETLEDLPEEDQG